MIAAWIVSMPPNMITRSWATASSSVTPGRGSFETSEVIDASGSRRQRARSACRTRVQLRRGPHRRSRCGSGIAVVDHRAREGRIEAVDAGDVVEREAEHAAGHAHGERRCERRAQLAAARRGRARRAGARPRPRSRRRRARPPRASGTAARTAPAGGCARRRRSSASSGRARRGRGSPPPRRSSPARGLSICRASAWPVTSQPPSAGTHETGSASRSRSSAASRPASSRSANSIDAPTGKRSRRAASSSGVICTCCSMRAYLPARLEVEGGDALEHLPAPGRVERDVVDELGRLDAERAESARGLGGNRRDRRLEGRQAPVVREDGTHAADELELRDVAAGGGEAVPQEAQVLAGGLPERVEAVGVADDAAQEARVHGLAAEPQPRPVRTPRLRLEVDVLVGVVLAGERGGGVAPEPLPGGEMLVEQRTALAERDAERLVFVPVPADGRLDDEAPLGEQVERAELAREEQRVAQAARSRRRRRGAGASSPPRSPRAARASSATASPGPGSPATRSRGGCP